MMDQKRGVGWRRGTADDLIVDGPVLLHSVTVNITTSGLALVLYDAQSILAGREIKSVYAIQNQETQLSFDPPLRLSQGLYVDVQANVVDFLVSYEEIEKDTATFEPHKPEVAV